MVDLEDDVFDSATHASLLRDLKRIDGKDTQTRRIRSVRFTSERESSGNVGKFLSDLERKNIQKKSSVAHPLRKPLERPVAKRIKRAVGFENVAVDLNKWSGVVDKNRKAEQLKFPLNRVNVSVVESEKNFKPSLKSKMEQDVYKLLTGAELIEEKEKTEEEKQIERAMSLKEIRERSREIWKSRILRQRIERKAARINKSKSRSYHKVLKKERLRKMKSQFEQLKHTDPEAALEVLGDIDKSRVMERMNLRHRKSKWLQAQGVKAGRDKSVKDLLQDNAQVRIDLLEKLSLPPKNEDSGLSEDEQEMPSHMKQILEEQGNVVSKANLDPNNAWVSHLALAKENEAADPSFLKMKKYWDDVHTQKMKEVEKKMEEEEEIVDKDEDFGLSGEKEDFVFGAEDEVSVSMDSRRCDSLSESDSGVKKSLKSSEGIGKVKDNLIETEGNSKVKTTKGILKTKKLTQSSKKSLESPNVNSSSSKKKRTSENSSLNTKKARKANSKSEHLKNEDFSVDESDDSNINKSDKIKSKKSLLKKKRRNENHENSKSFSLRDFDVLESSSGIDEDMDDNFDSEDQDSTGEVNNISKLNKSKTKSISKKEKQKNSTKKSKNTKLKSPKTKPEKDMMVDLKIDALFDDMNQKINKKITKKLKKSEKIESESTKSKNRTQKSKNATPKSKTTRDEPQDNMEFDFTAKDNEGMQESLTRAHTLEDLDKLESQKKSKTDLNELKKGTKPVDKTPINQDIKKVVSRKLGNTRVDRSIQKMLEESSSEDEVDEGLQDLFDDDDNVKQFRLEKEAKEKEDTPKDVNLFLKGWGSWAGPGIVPSKKKVDKFTIKAPEKKEHKYSSVGNVIYNEKADVHKNLRKAMVSQIPHPFTSVADFEASIRQPLGRKYVSEAMHRKLTAPSVVTKAGTVISPLGEEALLAHHDKTKRKSELEKKMDRKLRSNKKKTPKNKSNKKRILKPFVAK